MYEEELYNIVNKGAKDSSFSRTPNVPLDTYDYSGRAHVVYDGEAQNIDLIVINVSARYVEHSQMTPHIGDSFSTLFFGKAPMQVTVSCVLPDTMQNYGKTALLDAYKNKFRATAVACTGKSPTLCVKGARFTGPWVNLSITESAAHEDSLTLVFTLLVLQAVWEGDKTNVTLDYVSARETTKTGIKTAADQHFNTGIAYMKTAVRSVL